jgi:hypothetical protein
VVFSPSSDEAKREVRSLDGSERDGLPATVVLQA